MPSPSELDPVVVALTALGLQLLGAEAGRALGARAPAGARDGQRAQAAAIQAAVLALLGLLLAFSFSMAVDRYEQRRGLVVAESNAIGTTWLRTDVLPEPERSALRADLRRYVDARLAWFAAGEDPVGTRAALEEAEALQRAIWARAVGLAVAAPTDLERALLLESLNEAIDLSAARLAAHDAHVPDSIVVLLVGMSAAALMSVGATSGLTGAQDRLGRVLLAVLVAAILYVVLDLDQPRRGRIRVSQASLRDLQTEVQAE